MPDTNLEVLPGALIKSDLWNQLLARLGILEIQVQELAGSVPGGTVFVPDVFGRTLKDARGQITKPSAQLTVGFIVDAFGNNVDELCPLLTI